MKKYSRVKGNPRPVCRRCKTNKGTRTGSYVDGTPRYSRVCMSCKKGSARHKPYMITKGLKCKMCGFVAQHQCQLDIDHIDGNHQNNEIGNLQTLCSNCHRLKTYLNKDWET